MMKKVWVVESIRYKKDGAVITALHKDYKTEETVFLPAEEFIREALKEKEILDDEHWKKLKEDAAYFSAYRECLRKLSIKDRTEKEILDILYEQKGLTAEKRKEILVKLKKKNLVNDADYAENRIGDLRMALYGKNRIYRSLKEKGIEENLIREKLDSESPQKEVERGTEYARRLESMLNSVPYREKKTRLKQKLMTHGYDSQDCDTIIASITVSKDDEKEERLLEKAAESAYRRHSGKKEGRELKNAVIRLLLGKGFGYEDIMTVIGKMEEQNES